MVRPRTTSIAFLATGLIALMSAACSVLFSTSKEQCATDDDCKNRGAGFEGSKCSLDNVCVGGSVVVPGEDASKPDAPVGDGAVDPFACASEPLASPDPSRKIDVGIKYTDFTNGQPAVGLAVRLCAQTDPLCSSPRTTLEGAGPADAGVADAGAGLVATRADGTVTSKVEYGFEGFFEVKSPIFAPTYRYTSPPLKASFVFEQILLRPAEINFLADQALGKTNAYESVGHGLVFLFARDCEQKPLAGVSFTTSAQDPIMERFFIINTSPSKTDTQTDGLGRGGFVNVPPGLHTFTMEQVATKRRLGAVRILVRAGAATTVAILPSP